MKITQILTRILRTLALTGATGLAMLSYMESRFIYFPTSYPPDQTDSFIQQGGQRLEFHTSQGAQTAWLRLPIDEGIVPERVWIVTAGNGSLALDFADLAEKCNLRRDAFIFFDYPAYGLCEGKPNPDTIRESFAAAASLITERCGIPTGSLPSRGIVWGHSLGAAAALIAAEEYGIRQAVLLSPFTSTMEMTRAAIGLPLGFIVRHRYDNEARLTGLKHRNGRAWIIHGNEDEVIPVAMGHRLAAVMGDAANFYGIPSGRHNTLMQSALTEICRSMQDARNALPGSQ